MLQSLPPLFAVHLRALMQQLAHDLRLAIAHSMVQRRPKLAISNQRISALLQQEGSTTVVPAYQVYKLFCDPLFWSTAARRTHSGVQMLLVSKTDFSGLLTMVEWKRCTLRGTGSMSRGQTGHIGSQPPKTDLQLGQQFPFR